MMGGLLINEASLTRLQTMMTSKWFTEKKKMILILGKHEKISLLQEYVCSLFLV